MKLELAYYGDPILRRKADLVENFDDELRQFISDMEETMHASRGLGLAAPQVHKSIRVFMINIPKKDEEGEDQPGKTWVFVNPKILEFSEKTWVADEGCLSIPKLYEEVTRPFTLKIEAQDQFGEVFIAEFEGWEAKAILHENDHINGVLFIDRVHGKKRKQIEPILTSIKNKYYKKTS